MYLLILNRKSERLSVQQNRPFMDCQYVENMSFIKLMKSSQPV